jgi:hypothetical protein
VRTGKELEQWRPVCVDRHPYIGSNLDAIGATLQLNAAVKDQSGQLMSNPTITWQSLNAAVATVSASGLVTAVANGVAQIQATSDTAHAKVQVTVQQVASAVVKISGDAQTGLTGSTLPAPLVVGVNDRLTHPVANVSVVFAAATGSGSVSPTNTTTNGSGQAQTTWTMGVTAGQQSATATVTGITGAATFTATATSPGPAPTITVITPDSLVEGQPATISGTNFSATANSNTVTIDGVQATVTAATTTTLNVTVPRYSCRPARIVTVSVTVGGKVAGSSVPLHPAAFTTLAIGQEALNQDPTSFCLEFRAAASGPETYVFGVSTPAESPGTVLPFLISETGGITAAPPIAMGRAVAAPVTREGASGMTTAQSLFRLHRTIRGSAPNPELQAHAQTVQRRARAEAKIRRWEAQHLPLLRAQARQPVTTAPRLGGAITGAPPAVGDTILVRFPQAFTGANGCSTYVTIKTVVRVVGSAGIWLYDVQNPTADSLTQADIQNASNEFDTKIYATDTLQFGRPSDIDANSHVFIVLTWQVNKQAPNLLGFVWGGDLFPGPYCPQSNAGELYYGEAPDSLNQAGTGARPRSGVVSGMPRLIAHEFTHIIQFSQRLIFNNGQMLESWEAEGQATFAEELAGDAVLGNTSYQNYDHHVAFGPGGFYWYEDEMIKWAEYFGDLGSNNQAANAPDLCTVYGNTQLKTLPCDVSAFYGASWIFQRYIGDQFGPTYSGGLVQLTRDWVMKNPSLVGSANIAALLGVNYDTLFAHFATALALDDQNNGTGTAWVPRVFSITSWNSDSIATWISTCCQFGWLNPPTINFGTTSASRSVRGGSTAYTILSASGAHPAAAIALTDATGNPLSTGLRPTMWVVRIQ